MRNKFCNPASLPFKSKFEILSLFTTVPLQALFARNAALKLPSAPGRHPAWCVNPAIQATRVKRGEHRQLLPVGVPLHMKYPFSEGKALLFNLWPLLWWPDDTVTKAANASQPLWLGIARSARRVGVFVPMQPHHGLRGLQHVLRLGWEGISMSSGSELTTWLLLTTH